MKFTFALFVFGSLFGLCAEAVAADALDVLLVQSNPAVIDPNAYGSQVVRITQVTPPEERGGLRPKLENKATALCRDRQPTDRLNVLALDLSATAWRVAGPFVITCSKTRIPKARFKASERAWTQQLAPLRLIFSPKAVLGLVLNNSLKASLLGNTLCPSVLSFNEHSGNKSPLRSLKYPLCQLNSSNQELYPDFEGGLLTFSDFEPGLKEAVDMLPFRHSDKLRIVRSWLRTAATGERVTIQLPYFQTETAESYCHVAFEAAPSGAREQRNTRLPVKFKFVCELGRANGQPKVVSEWAPTTGEVMDQRTFLYDLKNESNDSKQLTRIHGALLVKWSNAPRNKDAELITMGSVPPSFSTGPTGTVAKLASGNVLLPVETRTLQNVKYSRTRRSTPCLKTPGPIQISMVSHNGSCKVWFGEDRYYSYNVRRAADAHGESLTVVPRLGRPTRSFEFPDADCHLVVRSSFELAVSPRPSPSMADSSTYWASAPEEAVCLE